MAITYVGESSGGFVTASSGADPAVPYPAGLQADDRLILIVGNGPATEPGTQTGFTKILGGLSGTGSQSPALAIYHKAATGSESGNFTVTNPGSGVCHGLLLAYRGVDTTTPIDDSDEASIGAVTAYTVPALTTSTTGATLVGATITNSGTGSVTPPTNPSAWTELEDYLNSQNLSVAHLVAWSGSGSTGSINFVRSSGIRGYAVAIALLPAAAGGTDVDLTGAVSDLAVTAPAGTVSLVTNVTATGAVGNIALAAPAGTVALVTNVTLTGTAAPIALAAPAGTVELAGSVDLTGAVADLTIAAPTGTVAADSTSDDVTLTGAVADLTLAAPAGTVDASSVGGDVDLTGAVADVTLAAPAGTVAADSQTDDVSLTGAVANLDLAAPAGTVTLSSVGDVDLVGAPAELTLTAPAGTVGITSNVTLTGPVAALDLAALAGTVATTTLVALTGATTGFVLEAPAGTFSTGIDRDVTAVLNPAQFASTGDTAELRATTDPPQFHALADTPQFRSSP